MADLVLGLATSHIAMITRGAASDDTDQVARYRKGFETLGAALREAAPDTLIIVSPDHVNRFFLDNMPAFCIGLFETFSGPAEQDTGIPDRSVASDPALAAHLLEHGLDHGVDWSRAEEWVVDHGFMVPLHMLDPEARLAAVPISVNCAAPPYPSIRRCHDVGVSIADAIRAWPERRRIAVVAGGGLSHSPGDARMGLIDSAFDERFLALLESGSRDAIVSLSHREIEAAGSSTAEIRSWIMLAGMFAGRKFERVTYEPIAEWVTGCAQAIVRP
jgi:aromatic ring-opening dioxygenase catalytic subunit (LigB family)